MFHKDDPKVKDGMDDLGAAGLDSIYCIRAITWAYGDSKLPKGVQAIPNALLSEAKIPLNAGGTVVYDGPPNEGSFAREYRSCNFGCGSGPGKMCCAIQ